LRLANRVKNLERTLIRKLFEEMPEGTTNLGLGQVDLPVPDELRSALQTAADGPGGYGPTAGDRVLRDAVAASYPGFADSGGDVLITAGCQQATFAVLGALTDPGDEVLVPRPGFPGAERAATAWGAEARSYRLEESLGFHIDAEALIAEIGPRTRALVVISPSNPLGSVEPAATIELLARGCAERGVALVLDDTYREFCWSVEGGAPGPPKGDWPNVVVCGGLSKSPGLAGWRIGWALCRDRPFMERLTALQQTLLTCASSPIQRAARVSFSDSGVRARRRIVETFAARKEIVARELIDRGIDAGPMEGGFYAWVRTECDALEFAGRLLAEERIMVIPGVAFDPSSANRIRLSFACEERLLTEALGIVRRRIFEGR
jgi:aspartate/methionine/tyrosine aminotransferase